MAVGDLPLVDRIHVTMDDLWLHRYPWTIHL